jgi:hypothetical protein
MSLIKATIDNNYNYNVLSNDIKYYLENKQLFRGIIMKDCFNRIHHDSTNFIPIDFNNTVIFTSIMSFIQNNNILANKIRKYVHSIIKEFKNIMCIDGEAYMYGLISNASQIIHFSNSEFICKDCEYNSKFYSKKVLNHLIDYNKSDDIYIPNNVNYCIINLSRLNKTLISKINTIFFKKIIIINCCHSDFWKKIKLLSNYKLVKRKKFIDGKLGYFITVNVLIHKNNFISIGSSCVLSWNLKRMGLRNTSYPFDWSNTSINQITSVFKNNFKDYEKIKIKKISSNHVDFNSGKPSYILKNNYNITFAHELCNENDIDEFINKLLKRIKKFKEHVFPTFVRFETCDVNKEKYNELMILLHKYFDNFEFILISHSNPHIKGISHIYLNVDFFDWKYEHFNWNKICNV